MPDRLHPQLAPQRHEAADVLAPAIHYAGELFSLSEIIAGQCEHPGGRLDLQTTEVYLIREGLRPPGHGEVFPSPRPVSGLRPSSEEEREVFYRGAMARRILATAATPCSAWVSPATAIHNA